MSNDQPQIVKLTWPVVFGLFVIEAIALIVAFSLYWFATQHELPSPIETTAIRRLLDEQATAWNRGDLDGYMAGYWRDEKLKFFGGGDITMGWQATLDRYRGKYQGTGKAMGRVTFADVEIQHVANDAATARGHWRLDFPDGKVSEGLFTLVLRRFGGDWRIVHDHSSSK